MLLRDKRPTQHFAADDKTERVSQHIGGMCILPLPSSPLWDEQHVDSPPLDISRCAQFRLCCACWICNFVPGLVVWCKCW